MRMKTIFDKTSIGAMSIENRIFRTACGDSHGKNGHISAEDISLYETLARGEIGAMITGYTYVSDYGMSEDIGMFGIYDDTFVEEYRELTNAVHALGGKILMQLVHLGSATLMKNVRIIAPSVVENPMTKTVPTEMTPDEIQRVEEDFARAAVRAKAAGFDGVELHFAHNFLGNQFLSPHYNYRADAYGGTADRRARFLVEVVERTRAALDADFPILVKMQSEETFDDGITADDFLSACTLIEQAGASAIEVSGTWMTYRQSEPYFASIATRLAERANIPVMLTGGFRDMETANRILESTNISYIGMCRPFINNPNLAREWKSGNTAPSKCVSCGACSRTHRCVLNGKGND